MPGSTHLVFIIFVQIDTTPLRLPPMLGNGFVDVGLMDDFGDELGHIIDQGRVRGGDLGAVDGIGRAIFDEEGEQGEDAAHEEGNDQDINDEEDGEASTHGDDGARSVGDEPGTSRTLPASRRGSIARAERSGRRAGGGEQVVPVMDDVPPWLSAASRSKQASRRRGLGGGGRSGCGN